MRKLRYKMRHNFIKIVLGIFIISIIFIGTGYSLLVENLNINGKANIIALDPQYKLDYTVESWQNKGEYYYNISINITNNSNRILENWTIKMDFPTNASIVNIWNATYQISNNTISFSNMSYNSNIEIGGSTSFGFQMKDIAGDFYPKNIFINDIPMPDPVPPEEPQGNVYITFSKSNEWQSGNLYYFNYNVNVSNMTNKKIKSWAFDMPLDTTTNVSQIWDAQYITSSGKITISNMPYNGNIASLNSINFGIIITTNDSNFVPQSINIVYK